MQGFESVVGLRNQRFIAAGQIAEIEHDRFDVSMSFCRDTIRHIGMVGEKKTDRCGNAIDLESLSGRIERALLNVEPEDGSVGTDLARQKQGVVTVTDRSVDSSVAGAQYLLYGSMGFMDEGNALHSSVEYRNQVRERCLSIGRLRNVGCTKEFVGCLLRRSR